MSIWDRWRKKSIRFVIDIVPHVGFQKCGIFFRKIPRAWGGKNRKNRYSRGIFLVKIPLNPTQNVGFLPTCGIPPKKWGSIEYSIFLIECLVQILFAIVFYYIPVMFIFRVAASIYTVFCKPRDRRVDAITDIK